MTTFETWLQTARRGETLTYYSGELSRMRQLRAGKMFLREYLAERHEGTEDELQAARDAWQAYEDGRVTLTQRRVGAQSFAYVAVRL
jgi:hypothetical protein